MVGVTLLTRGVSKRVPDARKAPALSHCALHLREQAHTLCTLAGLCRI